MIICAGGFPPGRCSASGKTTGTWDRTSEAAQMPLFARRTTTGDQRSRARNCGPALSAHPRGKLPASSPAALVLPPSGSPAGKSCPSSRGGSREFLLSGQMYVLVHLRGLR